MGSTVSSGTKRDALQCAHRAKAMDGLRQPILHVSVSLSALANTYNFGAGDGDRTHTAGLEGRGSTIELHPHYLLNYSAAVDVLTP